VQNALLIDMKNVGKIYAQEAMETHALTMANLQLSPGSFLAITGPSGCGKSTLLSIMGLLDRFTTGSYRFKGLDTAVLDRDSRASLRNHHIGFIFQSFNLIHHLTAAENVALPLSWRKDLTKDAREAHTQQALEKVGLSHRCNHYPCQLSGGQQQRVAIARAMAGNPDLILADEPTGSLDSKNANHILDLLGQLHEDGATICLATHHPKMASGASRAIELLDGQIVAEHRV